MVGRGLGDARVQDRVASLRDQRDLDGHYGSHHLAGAASDERIEPVVRDRWPSAIQVVDGRPATAVGIKVVNGTVPSPKGVFHARGDHPPQKIDIDGVIGIPHCHYRATVSGANTELVRMGHADLLCPVRHCHAVYTRYVGMAHATTIYIRRLARAPETQSAK